MQADATRAKELARLIEAAKARWTVMTPAEHEAELRQQCEGYVKAEMSSPKPMFEWINGVKVYASYEDYCND